jgi:NAD-dependent DNA ligase
MSTIQYIRNFQQKGWSFLSTLHETIVTDMFRLAKTQYYEATPILTDHEFDVLQSYIETNYPESMVLEEIGAPIASNEMKVPLPVYMPSMNKIKASSDVLTKWTSHFKGPYVISCKLDGVSGLYYTMDKTRKLYTRGDGTVGQDISKLLDYIQIIHLDHVIIRGEFIVSKSVFDAKYQSTCSNIRNMVAGVMNTKHIDSTTRQKLADIEFVAYEVIQPILTPSEQLRFLQKHGFKTVDYKTSTTITTPYLSQTLIEWRKDYRFEIDGLIISSDHLYNRTQKNPAHSIAFKMVLSDQEAETQVVDVIWTASKDGYLKPRVRVVPVEIGGVTIEYATGFNGKFIQENKIGIGAVIQIIRSGDVIPYINKIIIPATYPKMPEIEYSWTESKVDIILVDKENDPVVLEKRITVFFQALQVEGLSGGYVKRLIEHGFNNIPKILKMTQTDFLTMKGFQERLSEKIYTAIQTMLQTKSIAAILAAANTFGRGMGEAKINLIFDKYPEILFSQNTKEKKLEMLQAIKGIGAESASLFVENISNSMAFLQECGIPISESLPNQPEQDTTHALHKKTIVLSGFRDKTLTDYLEQHYGTVCGSTVNKNTFVLVVKSKEDTSTSKIQQAQRFAVPIITIDEFKRVYLD